MDTRIEYRLMCLNAPELQDLWNPEEGDFMVSKASYCDNDCSEDKPCNGCLEMDNVYVISGKFNFSESIGGTHWFFGGSPCVKGDGCICNDTYSFVMTESGISTNHQLYTSAKSKMLWLPRQDQIQSMFLNGLTEIHKAKEFTKWLDKEISFNAHTYSLEMLWLMFYMCEVHNKMWNETSNIKKWECI